LPLKRLLYCLSEKLLYQHRNAVFEVISKISRAIRDTEVYQGYPKATIDICGKNWYNIGENILNAANQKEAKER